MQNELEDSQEYYHSLNHEDWCELLSTIKVKDNRKRAATQIKIIETSIEGSHYNSDECIRALCNKRARNFVLRKKRKGKISSIMVYSTTVCFAISQECLREVYFAWS